MRLCSSFDGLFFARSPSRSGFALPRSGMAVLKSSSANLRSFSRASEHVASALVYVQYDFFKRQVMKLIVWKGGGPTDATQDYEFTDRRELDKFVDSFIASAAS